MAKRRLVKRSRRVPEYTCLGCPKTKSHSLWCHRICVPVNGIGFCGRVAPHAVTGRTQQAILRYKIREAQREAQVA